MNLSAEEKIMYRVMTAICNSGIPMSFKGSMVLKACLLEAGYSEDTRHTVDIDGNWYSDAILSEKDMAESLQKALDNNGLCLEVSISRLYGKGRSAGFDLIDKTSGEALFSMDIDVNHTSGSSRIYELEGVSFRGVSPSQMIADKVQVLSSDKIFRRIKDLIDLYYLSHIFEFDVKEIIDTINESGRMMADFSGFLFRSDELKHSYEKFRFAGDIPKPAFDEIYSIVKEYVKDFLPKK